MTACNTSVSIAINLIDVLLEFSQSEHQFFLVDNLLFSVLFYSQLSSTVPCCTRVKNTSRRFYILTILQKVSRWRMSHQNSKYFLATECVCSRKASWCICIIKLAWCLKELDVIHIAIWNNTEAKTKARANGVSFWRQPRSTVWFICLTM